MKKLFIAIIIALSFCLHSVSAGFNYEKIYKKIDIIYEKNPTKLIVLKSKLSHYGKKYRKITTIFSTINTYIDRKLDMYKKSYKIQKLDTSNWKTYYNKKYNFSFKYPKDAEVSEGSGVEIPTNKGEFISIKLKNGQFIGLELPDYEHLTGGAPSFDSGGNAEFRIKGQAIKRDYVFYAQSEPVLGHNYDYALEYNVGDMVQENVDGKTVSVLDSKFSLSSIIDIKYTGRFTDAMRDKKLEAIMETILYDIIDSGFTIPKDREYKSTTLNGDIQISFTYERVHGFHCIVEAGRSTWNRKPETLIETNCIGENGNAVFRILHVRQSIEGYINNKNFSLPDNEKHRIFKIAGYEGKGFMKLEKGKTSYKVLIPMKNKTTLELDFGNTEMGNFIDRQDIQKILDTLNVKTTK